MAETPGFVWTAEHSWGRLQQAWGKELSRTRASHGMLGCKILFRIIYGDGQWQTQRSSSLSRVPFLLLLFLALVEETL